MARLGEGAMGTVYRARDPVLDREVALKTVSPRVLGRPDALTRFQREARAAARLQHPNIVTVYELGEVDGVHFIAMELLEGQDLAQVLQARDRPSLRHLLKMVAEICRALDYAHKRGVIHRDVKPANVRVLLDGSVKLVDFGIARLADSNMTQTGMVLGTPAYTAPEVLRTGRVDHRADMWAVGVILYEILAGRRPFQGDSIPILAQRVIQDPVPPLDAAALGVPAALIDVAERALRKAPAERYQDLAEMALAVEISGGLSGPLAATLTPEDRRRASLEGLELARRLLARDELEGALEAARRAQALDPSSSDVLALVEDIEGRLDALPTLVETTPPASARAASAPTVLVPGGRAGPAPRRADLETLGSVGAAAFREVALFGEPPASQGGACLTPAGDRVALAGSDGAIRIWDLRSRTRALVLRTEMHLRTGHEALALSLALSPDGALLASGHVDGAVRLWSATDGAELPVRLRHDGLVGALAFSPDGARLASGSVDATVKLWDLDGARAGDARRELVRQPSAVGALCYAEDGSWLASGHANRVLRLIDPASRRLVATLRGPEALVTGLAARGPLLVAASQDRTLRVLDVPTRRQVLSLPQRRPIAGFSLFPDGRLAATVHLDNALRVWDLSGGRELLTLWGHAEESFTAVAVSPDGTLVAALADGRLRLWAADGA